MADRTEAAVRWQIHAMGCQRYEIGVLDAEHGRMINRTMDVDGIVRSIAWLKRQNARGEDIYIRPTMDDPTHGIVLVDDLSLAAKPKIQALGVTPSVIVETSPQSFQAWIRVADRASAELRLEIARDLARELGGDPGGVGARQYGRLAGFTNRKPKHRQTDGLAPFVLLHVHDPHVCKAGPERMHAAARAIADREHAQRLSAPFPAGSPAGCAEEAYARVQEHVHRQGHASASHVDFRVAMILLGKGFNPCDVERAMRALSLEIERRKLGHVEDYVRRTVENAAARLHTKPIVGGRPRPAATNASRSIERAD